MQNSIVILNIFPFIIAMVAGALVPFQAGSNAALGKAIGHPLWATMLSLLISIVLTLIVIVFLKLTKPEISTLSNVPYWAWAGGIIGVIYITSALMLTPRLGATSFIVCVIAGQLIASLVIDSFGLVGLAAKEINPARILGVTCVFIGSLIVSWSNR